MHKALAEWWLDDYVESVREGLAKLRDGHPEPGGEADYAYLLLAEAEQLVRSQEHVYLWPCDCRALMGACDQSWYNCLRFHNDRDLGWEISKERAVEILREADAAGLTHTDYVGFGGDTDPHAICNCCTDCCQPHLAAERLGVSDIWPRRRHVATSRARRLHVVRPLHGALPVRRDRPARGRRGAHPVAGGLQRLRSVCDGLPRRRDRHGAAAGRSLNAARPTPR